MKNFVQPGNSLDFVAAADLVGGQGLLIQDVFGVVAADALTGEDAVMDVEGVFTLPKAGDAITQFEKAYWDDTAKDVTTDPTGNKLIGVFTADALLGDAEVNVRIGVYPT